MVYDGYLAFGGNEILNNERARGIAESAGCALAWYRCGPCPGLPLALGNAGVGYTYADIANAPWYDASLPLVSENFYGVYGLSIENVADSTREASVTQAIGDGGVIGLPRRAVREIRVRALLLGAGREAVDYGMGYLDAVLDPDACGRHSAECGTAEMEMYADCPPTPDAYTMPETAWGTPLENLATNPSFETAGPPNQIRTNLATNPSFEATTAATVEVRRNLAVIPRATSYSILAGTLGWANTRWWGGGTGAGTYALVTGAADGPLGIATYARKAWTAVGTGTGDMGFTHFGTAVQAMSVVPGEIYTVSSYLRASANYGLGGAGGGFAVSLVFYDGAGVPIGAETVGARAALQPGIWTRAFATATVPAGAVTMGALSDIDGAVIPAVGFTLDGTALLVEKSPVMGDYIDGSTVAAGDFTYAWVGSANSSQSVQYGIAVVGAAPTFSAPITSTEWASSGTRSCRIIPNNVSSQSRTVIVPQRTVAPGEVYTITATFRLSAPLTGTLWAQSRMLSVYYPDIPLLVYSAAAPNAAGVYTVTMTVTVPAGATKMDVRANNGAAQGGGDLWVDDVMVVAGTYTGPYFDGSGPPKVRRNLALNPRAIEGGSSFQPSSGGTASYLTDYPGAIATAARFTQTVAGVGMFGPSVGTAFPQNTDVTFRMKVRASEVLTGVTARQRPGGIGSTGGERIWTSTSGVPDTIPAGESIVTWTGPTSASVPNGSNMIGLRWAAGSVGATLDITEITMEVAPALPGGFFDGSSGVMSDGLAGAWEGTANASPSYLYDADFTYAWTGTAHASTSTQSALTLAGIAQPPGTQALAWRTGDTPADRSYAGRFQITSPPTSAAAITVTFGTGITQGTVYTLIGKVRPRTRTQVMQARIAFANGPLFTAPVGVWTPFALTIAAGAGGAGTQTGLLINASSGHQTGDLIDIDAVAIVAGEYTGGYFDGSFPDDMPSNVVGTILRDYAWTGAADASTSTVITGEVVEVPDALGYAEATANKLRFMRRAGVISGPFTINEYARGNLFAREVEFTFAGGPAILGVTRPIELGPSIPGVVQDMPYNLAPYPSAELVTTTTDWLGATTTDAGTKLTVPGHITIAGGQTTHPSVLDFGSSPLNGYRYWMAHTPYPGGSDAAEDPNIVASKDGTTWVIPTGLTNPLDDKPGSPGAYNSDVELVRNPNGSLLLLWRTYDPAATGAEEKLYIRNSSTGTVWSTKQLVLQNNKATRRLVSPTLIYENGGWTMWAVDTVPSPNRLVRLRSEGSSMSPGAWSAPVNCTVTVPAGRDPWHVQIRYIDGKYVGLLNDCTLDVDGTAGDLYMITSTDGLTFSRAAAVAIPRSGGTSPGHQSNYRASLVQKSSTQLDVWFGGWNTGPPQVWNIFRTTLKAVQSGGAVIATNYARNPSAELSEAGPTYTGWGYTFSGIPTGVITLTRSTSFAAAGSDTSMRLRAAPITSGTNGSLAIQNTSHTFPAIVAGQRMSIGLWIKTAVSGTAVLGVLTVLASWKTAGSTVGSTTITQTLPVPGSGYVSLPSIVPPVGADSVLIQASLAVTSWSSGAVIDLYADTVTASLP